MPYKYLKNIKCPDDLKKLDISELPELCNEIRQRIIEVVSKTGGHLASSLGVVELTVALHYVFDSPNDKIIWDVGHQCYAHKIITGRNDRMETIRQFGGLSGFIKPDESPHDFFGVGHASTSISAALGFAVARDKKGEKHNVIVVIGDASLCGGIAFEALNNVSQSTKKFLVILNDNEMSISKNVGALSAYLNRIITSPIYNKYKKEIEEAIKKIPTIGENVFKSVRKIEESIKNIIVPGVVFEEFGFNYYGPSNGHDVIELVRILNNLKKIDHRPLLFHIITKKGKGHNFAEKQPETYHGISPQVFKNGKSEKISSGKTYSDIFGEVMVEEAKKKKNLVAVVAAMETGTGLKGFHKKYPDRFFDVGIAEQHAVTFAAGLAKEGMKPVVAIYSTFMQRAYDQVVHDVALQNLPVLFCMDRAGIVGDDGPTHHGVFDISFMRHIPNVSFCQPADEDSFREMIRIGIEFNGPFAIRYPRGKVLRKTFPKREKVKYGKSWLVKEGHDGAIISLGQETVFAWDIIEILRQTENLDIALIDARFIKPLDEDLIGKTLRRYKKIAVFEENVFMGGFGSAVLEFSAKINTKNDFFFSALPDKFIEHGDIENIRRKYGLDKNNLTKKLIEFYKK